MNVQTIALVALFNDQDELLLLKRPDDAHCGGLWSLPGGKLRDGEAALAAAQRELIEETAVAGAFWSKLGESLHAYPDRTLRFQLFACRCRDTAGLAPESEAAWVQVSELGNYPMPEANAEFMPLLESLKSRPSQP